MCHDVAIKKLFAEYLETGENLFCCEVAVGRSFRGTEMFGSRYIVIHGNGTCSVENENELYQREKADFGPV